MKNASRIVLTVATLLLVLPAYAADRFACEPDPLTGFPLPRAAAGLCVTGLDAAMKLILRNDDGLLVFVPESTPADLSVSNTERGFLLNFENRQTNLVFCPSILLDPMTGAPTPRCISDVSTFAAGPAALVGSGHATGNVYVDANLETGCPSSVHVTATVESPAGDLFDLDGSMALSPRDRSCEVVHQAIKIAFAAPPTFGHPALSDGTTLGDAELRRLASLDERDWVLVEALARLDDTDWNVMQKILALEPEQVTRLDALLQKDGGAVLGDDGTVLQIEEVGSRLGTVVRANGVGDLIRDVLNRINNIVIPRIDSIRARIPDRGDIRELLSGIEISPIADALQQVKEIFAGVLAIAQDLRAGFEDWEGGGCDATSGCGQFKSDITALLADIRDAAEFIQTLACIRKPGLEIKELNTSRLEELINDQAPHVILYALSKTLDRIAPEWSGLISTVLDEIPADTRADFVELCESDEPNKVLLADKGSVASGQPLCKVLRSREVGLALVGAKAVANKNESVASFLDRFIKDNLNQAIGAVAAAGATVGFNIKNPAKITTEMLEDFAKKLPDMLDNIIDKRDDCLEADADIESDLLECLPRSTYLIYDLALLEPFPRFKDAVEIVDHRRDQAEKCQGRGACQDLDVEEATDRLEAAEKKAGTPAGFQELCCAYDALIGRPRCGRTGRP